jgi:glyceraldehyde-3-phosphate dehydrogenase/erythrose-4-phosphate dehydrogenase
MAVRVGINGFGRIGRQSLKAIIERAPELEVVAVNDIVDVPTNALLFAHDSTYGNFHGTVTHTDDSIVINGKAVKVLQVSDPAQLPWKDLGVDIVIESTGRFTEADKARAHITAGARRSSSAPRPRARTSPSSSASTKACTTPPSTRSSATPAARPTAWRRSRRSSTIRSVSSRA